MLISHKGMRIDAADWSSFIGHVEATLQAFAVPAAESADVLGFVQSLQGDIVEG
jgi:hemoglobin